MKRVLLAILFMSNLAAAQGPTMRPATEVDFVGYWKVLVISNDLHGSRYKNEDMGYSAPCQFFIHKPDGAWNNLIVSGISGDEESKRECPSKRSRVEEVERVVLTVERQQEWQKAPNQNGLFIVRHFNNADPSSKIRVFWKADYVLADIPAPPRIGFDLKKGDMIMQITRSLGGNNIAPVWPMVLRPVLE